MKRIISLFLLLLITTAHAVPLASMQGIIASQDVTEFVPTDIAGLQLWNDYLLSGGRHYITANGDAKITTAVADPFVASTGVGIFDGSDYIECSDNADFDQLADFTQEFFIIFDSFSTNQVVIGRDVGYIMIQFQNVSNQMVKIARYAEQTTATGGNLSIDTWYHIALVRSGSTMTAYVDGTAVCSGTDATAVNLSTPLNIGRNGATYTDYFAGKISNVRLSNIARYTTTFTPPTEPFTADSNTVFLAPMTGTNNSTVFVDNAIPADSSQISSWNDLSGNYNHLTEATNKPTMDTTNGITFDGVNDKLSKAIPQSQPITIYCVANVTAGTGVQGLLGDSNVYLSVTSDEFLNLYSGSAITGSTDISGANKIFTAVINNTSSEILSNATSQATGTTGTGSLSTFNLGTNGTNFSASKFKAILLYSGAHNSGQQAQVRNYLNSKYTIY